MVISWAATPCAVRSKSRSIASSRSSPPVPAASCRNLDTVKRCQGGVTNSVDPPFPPPCHRVTPSSEVVMPNVLVVDDSPLDRFLAGSLLEANTDLTAVYAEDGQQALERSEERRVG